MQITSLTFYLFVGISLLIYWRLPHKYQWVLLLIDSLLFYFINSTYYTIIYALISVISIYYATNYFNSTANKKKKKIVLIIVLILNIGILASLKYANLFIDTFNIFSKRIVHIKTINNVKWLVPLAISFYTLQMISYLLDCYWGIAKAYNNIFHLLLYCTYFPLLTSGPICRYSEIGEELFKEHRFDYNNVKYGIFQIAIGLVKKLVVSNRLAVIVNQMWDSPITDHGINVWIAMFFFILQLYTDFSGCMDMVSGISKCFGIDLPDNFKAPLLSKNIQEFWRRWHITLGTWLRDYVMNPILKSKAFVKLNNNLKNKFGRKLAKKIPMYLAMLVLWFCMGLWHGNNWKYVLGEGLWFWLIIVLSNILNPIFESIKIKLKINDENIMYKMFEIVRTFIIYMFGMIFFRANSLSDAFIRIKNTFPLNISVQTFIDIRRAVDFDDLSSHYGLVAITIGMILILIIDIMKYQEKDFISEVFNLKTYKRWILYYLIVILLMSSLSIVNQEILYAQF